MHLLSQIIYFCKMLCMFWTVFPSIIRSLKLRIQQRYMLNSCCYLLLSGMRWKGRRYISVQKHQRKTAQSKWYNKICGEKQLAPNYISIKINGKKLTMPENNKSCHSLLRRKVNKWVTNPSCDLRFWIKCGKLSLRDGSTISFIVTRKDRCAHDCKDGAAVTRWRRPWILVQW